MRERLSWFPWYYERFLASRKTRKMEAEEVGVYLLLIQEQWEKGAVTDDSDELVDIGRAEIDVVRNVLNRCFVSYEDGWRNSHLENVRSEQKKKHERASAAGRAGAKARWDKEQDGDRMRPHGNHIAIDKKRIEKKKKLPAGEYDEFFETFWKLPWHPNSSKLEAHRKWLANFKTDITTDDMTAGAVRYHAYCDYAGTAREFRKHASTFIGQNRHWEGSFIITESDKAKKNEIDPAKDFSEFNEQFDKRTRESELESTSDILKRMEEQKAS